MALQSYNPGLVAGRAAFLALRFALVCAGGPILLAALGAVQL